MTCYFAGNLLPRCWRLSVLGAGTWKAIGYAASEGYFRIEGLAADQVIIDARLGGSLSRTTAQLTSGSLSRVDIALPE